jgi:hypothetical protein
VAEYTVPAGHIGVHEKTAVAGSVDTVTFEVGAASAPGWARRLPRQVEILTDGAAAMYVTVDGSTPTVAGSHCYPVPAAAGSTVIDVRDANAIDAVVVKLISSGTPVYSVSRAG